MLRCAKKITAGCLAALCLALGIMIGCDGSSVNEQTSENIYRIEVGGTYKLERLYEDSSFRSSDTSKATVSESGDEAEAQTEVRQISKEMLATPVRLSEEVTHNALFFRWDDVEGTTRYHFELVKESAPDSPLNAVTEIDFANDYSYRPAIVTGNLEPQTAYHLELLDRKSFPGVSNEEFAWESPEGLDGKDLVTDTDLVVRRLMG